ncbi:MAG: Heterodimeric efflux ABC transporter, permease/ATP-binding subunit 1 [uncultured Chloroflexi bacterium]|uniref:Heterodimeric efflux ABC transporter, permease/ATP-binding subunit 1 n=1 Tax=uncultured Chloroflexota bacterium TaxID=166587 RepID=A0A6J4K3P5_9CHLR|nr:MAG: Heterodimeric efflux ABC transporter, permease/ATP-binding subunit 1 [uncultured Chloroflexota bacterium]
MLTLAALLLAGIAFQLVGPQLVRQFIDSAQAGAPPQVLMAAAAWFLLSTVASQALGAGAAYMGEQVGWSATNAVRADLLRHVLTLDLSFHHSRTPGELIERIDGDVTTLSNFFSRFTILILGSVLLLLGALALLYREDWRVGLAMTAFVVVALGVLARVRDLAVPYWRDDRQESAAVFGFLEERLVGLPDLHASGARAYVVRRFAEHFRSRYRVGQRAMLAGSITWAATNVLLGVCAALGLALGVALHTAAGASLGTVYLIYSYTWVLRRPLEQITRQVQDLQKASAGIGRVQELLAQRGRLIESAPGAAVSLPEGPLAVELQDLRFRYRPDQEPVLHDVRLSLAPGRTLGILGRTGSGKTTIGRLLFRLYDVDQGAVLLGGVDVRHARLHDVQRRVGLVTQEVQLFGASVRDNLTLFDPTVPDARLLEVMEELGLGAWLRALPAGLDTQLAPSGGLSAGEAQLLALTRVFLRDPGLVVLDEASSRLDPATEALIDRAVRRLLAGRTAIVIAHRLATVLRADDVLVLAGGRVLEHSPRAALQADPDSHFSRLLRAGELEVLA